MKQLPSYTNIFRQSAEKDPAFRDACDVVAMNTAGRYWVCGGYVFRTLARALHGRGDTIPDIDIMTEEPFRPLSCPPGWVEHRNRYGNPKLIRADGLEVDIWRLRDVHGIRLLGLRATLRNYLKLTPLTIQSIVYDVGRRRIIGATGIRTLQTGTVSVHHPFTAGQWSQKYGIPLERMVRDKAESIGFTALYAHAHNR